jgi:Tol biopolymer transport system component/predicted Ser/Thr protein kinase
MKLGNRQEVEGIFHQALERDPAERDAFVLEACRGDSELHSEVSSLLAHHDEGAGFEPWAAAAAAQLITAPASLQPGQLLGPYRIESFVAAGGMGQVYRATDTRLNRAVAIKICAGPFSERFAQEAKVIASLNHPHICQLYDVGSNYLVMEFVEGSPLRGPLSVKQAVEYARQILEALDTAHRKGITHRDLKPANILVTKQGVKLLDFGLARRSAPLPESDATVTAPLTGKGEILGTLQYMSPEQLQGKEADARSDLFSFGCVLYEMLSGKRAFEGQSAASVIAAILERDAAPLDLAPPLERVIQTCLAKDPEQRFQNAIDLKTALTWALEQPITTKPNRRVWIAAATATLILAALGGAWAVSHFGRASADDRVLRLQVDPPPGGRLIVGGTIAGDPAISPDGKMVAYVVSVNGKTGIWVRPLEDAKARLLPGTENAGQPFWSPDSAWVAFRQGGGKISKVNKDGGTPVEILSGIRTSRGASWGSDGYILVSQVERGAAPFSVYSIYRSAESSGRPSLVTTPELSRGEVAYRWPQVLPEGHFLYGVEAAKPEDSGAYAASLTKPADRVKVVSTESRVVYAPGANGTAYLLWTRGGALVAQEFNPHTLRVAGEPREIAEAPNGATQGDLTITASATGLLLYAASGQTTQLAWWDRTGKQISKVGEPIDGIVMFRLSPDERQIAIQRKAGEVHDLWLLDSERGIANRFTADRTLTTQPVWSPDGGMILFTHLGSSVLFRKPANGIGGEQLVFKRPTNNAVPLDWSRDGRWVLTRETSPDAKYDIWKLPITSDGKMQDGVAPGPYLQTRFNEQEARFSPEPNPRRVAYASDESGRYEIYVDAFPEPRGKKRISISGGRSPQLGAEGRDLFFVSPENKVMAVSLRLGADKVEPSAPRELFQLPLRATAAGPTYQASRDGQRFLVLTNAETAPQSLNVIVNWPALLKKRATAP